MYSARQYVVTSSKFMEFFFDIEAIDIFLIFTQRNVKIRVTEFSKLSNFSYSDNKILEISVK